MNDGLSIIDSHAHLDYPQLKSQLSAVIDRAAQHGVTDIITIGTTLSATPTLHSLAKKYKNIWFSVGIHPNEVKADLLSCDLDAILEWASYEKCVAIGETGLDYHYDHTPRDLQKTSFRIQIEAARRTGLPVIIHARDADDDIAHILEEEMEKGAFTGVLHSFSSGADLAKRALDIGFYISFSGILTFKNADTLREIASWVDNNRLLVETDSPYLAPVPHRGKPNEPGFTRYVLKKLAEIKHLSETEMATITKQNSLRLFSRLQDSSIC